VLGLQDHETCSELLFSPADSCVTTQLQLFGQLLPQWSGAVQVWMLSCGSGDQLYDLLPAMLSRWLIILFTESSALGGYFFALPLFSGASSVFHPPPLLSVLDYSSLFDFQFCRAVQFWMLFSCLGNQLCDPLPALLWGVAYSPPALILHCLSCAYLLIAPCSSPFLWCSFSVPPASSGTD
jgi:hypothetical protein